MDKLFFHRKKHTKWCQLSKRKELSTPSLQYLMLPNQTAENGQVVFSQEKAHKMVSIVKKEGAVNTIIAIPNAPKPNSRKWTSCFFTGKSTQNGVNCQKGRSCQLKRHKKRQSTRSKMPLQSLIFSSSCTLSIYCGSKEK